MHLGLPEAIDPSLFRYLPEGVDVTRIGEEHPWRPSPGHVGASA